MFFISAARCATFYYKQEMTPSPSNRPIKLRRSEELCHTEDTCVFSYGTFVSAMKEYLDGNAAKPDPETVLVFGQEVTHGTRLDSYVLVSASVTTKRAADDLITAEKAVSGHRKQTIVHWAMDRQCELKL